MKLSILVPLNGTVIVWLILSNLSSLAYNSGETTWFDTGAETATAAPLPFVTKSNNQLVLNNVQFKFAGANIFWLGLLDNPVRYPTKFEADDALATAREMGATVVRSHTLGISVGCALCLEPSLNVFNSQAFETIDYALKSARDNNLRLIVPVTDNWRYYHGGKSTFTSWRGLTDENAFFTDRQVIQDFKSYLTVLLNHINPYTKLALKDDPTILAWETGNELSTPDRVAGLNWNQEIATFIKSLAPRQLVADGFSASTATGLQADQLNLDQIDLVSSHFYPTSVAALQRDAAIAQQYNKVFFVGEYDWTGQSGAQADGTLTIDKTVKMDGASSARVDVTKSGTYWYVQLTQGNLPLTANKKYRLSFLAKASVARPIQVNLNLDADPYTELLNSKVNLSSGWAGYEISYTPTQPLSKVLLSFNFADSTGKVWLDRVSLKDESGNELLTNGSFENSADAWNFNVKQGGDSLSSFLSAVENSNSGVSGDLFWSLFGHKDNSGFIQHDDGNYNFTLHYPGDNQDMAGRAQKLRSHGYQTGGKAVPAGIVPSAPVMNLVVNTAKGNQISWQGVVGANTYSLEKSGDKVKWTVVASDLTDNNAPYLDSSKNNGTVTYYRIRATSINGVAGAYSLPSPVTLPR